MSDNEADRPPRVPPIEDEASAADSSPAVEPTEGRRGERLDESPEARLMHEGSIPASQPSPRAPDRTRAHFDELDDAAADEARMDVRRREHSAE